MKKLVFAMLCLFFLSFAAKPAYATAPETIWQFQCIDTMKSSRDAARAWETDPSATRYITKELDAIAGMGANCVAIDTPYDEEFISVLTKWVASAREHHLQVWFRGNFSGYEGWFGYPRGLSTQEELLKTQKFIQQHANLFADNDMFTPVPEAENAGLFADPKIYRQFLVDEYNTATDAFSVIGKDVKVNLLSMSGGVAKQVLDAETLQNLGETVTIDHYVNAPEEMTSFVDYFVNTYHAKVVIGEFGAPIPNINGNMTEDEQAMFIDKVMFALYKKHSDVLGVNYWDLYGGSTALLNPDFSNRKVVTVIKKYFQPMVIQAKVVDTNGDAVQNIVVATQDNSFSVATNSDGDASLIVPVATTTVVLPSSDYTADPQTIDGSSGDTYVTFTAKPEHPSLLFRIKHAIKNLF